MIIFVQTDTRGLLRVHDKIGIATLTHICAVRSASTAAFGRTVLATTYCVGATSLHGNGHMATETRKENAKGDWICISTISLQKLCGS